MFQLSEFSVTRGCTTNMLTSCYQPCVTFCRSLVKTAPVLAGDGAESCYESFAPTRWSTLLQAGSSATVSAHAFNALPNFAKFIRAHSIHFYANEDGESHV